MIGRSGGTENDLDLFVGGEVEGVSGRSTGGHGPDAAERPGQPPLADHRQSGVDQTAVGARIRGQTLQSGLQIDEISSSVFSI